jgi:hypothetical protein
MKNTFLALSKCWEKLAIKLEEAFAQLAESEAQGRTPREQRAPVPIYQTTLGRPYPSKYDANVLYNNPDQLKGQCNDGDGVIFNGVLCISGDDRGCDAVRRSQAGDGEFWRSPRKVGVFSKDETPFSNDHELGVWAYIAHKKDKVAFRKWIDWIDGQPYPRFCQDKNCIFGVSDCPMLDALALILLESNKVCDPQHKVIDLAAKAAVDAQRRFNDAIAQLYKIPGSAVLRSAAEPLKASFAASVQVLLKATQKSEEVRIQAATYARDALSGAPSLIVGINALVNNPGPGQWDAAVEILLLKKFFRLKRARIRRCGGNSCS